MSSLSMTRSEREAFLAGVHVGVVSVEEAGHGPLAVPVWYAFEPGGEIVWVTARHSRKGRALAAAERMSMCVQDERPPYKYVSVEGPFSLEMPDFDRHIRAIAHRYLGARAGEQYVASSGNTEGSVLVRLRPERWLTIDYGKM